MRGLRKIVACYSITSILVFIILAIQMDAHAILSPLESGTSKVEVYRLTVFGENLSPTDFSPTVSIVIEIPRGFDIVDVINITGWDYRILEENRSLKLVWSGYLPLGRTSDLLFKLKNPDVEGSYEFRVFQRSLMGTTIMWNDWNYSGIHGSSYLTVKITRIPSATPPISIYAVAILLVVALVAGIAIRTVKGGRGRGDGSTVHG